ncbi:50S ribosomal protein L24 [bacterium]|nr:50S ribosomal protein L24 [bacterium]
MKIKKGDKVKILYGKETGKTGVVAVVNPKNNTVVVEGLNLYKRHIKGDGRTRTSEIITIEKPFPASKVMFICPLCGKATRIKMKKDDKKVVRVCAKCGKEIAEVESKKKSVREGKKVKEVKVKTNKKEEKKNKTK